jgi:hypothetical protein
MNETPEEMLAALSGFLTIDTTVSS